MLKEDQIFMKERLRTLLQTNVVEVTFTKKDKTRRVMNCTLDYTRMNGATLYTDSNRKVNEDVLAVWDVDKNAWRSFRIDSIDMYIVKRSNA